MIKTKKPMFKIIFSFIIALLFLFNDMNSTYGTIFLSLLLVCTCVFDNSFRINKYSALTCIFLLLSYFFSGIQTQSLENTILLSTLVLGVGNIKLEDRYKDFIVAFTTIFTFLLSVYQFIGDGIAYGPFFNIFNIKQIYPNALAALSLLLLAYTNKRSLTLLNIVNIVLSKSRIGIVIMLLVMLYKNLRKIKQSHRLLAVTCTIVALVFTFNYQKSPQSTRFTSIDQRVEHMTLTPKLFDTTTLLFGQGAGSFSYLFPSVQRIPLNNAPHSHNIILNLLLEYGVWTVLFLILFIKGLWNNQSMKTRVAWLAFGVFNLFNVDYQFPLTIFLLIVLSDKIEIENIKSNYNQKLLPALICIMMIVIPLNTSQLSHYISHKDYWIRQGDIDIYQNQSPLDIQAHKLRPNTSDYSQEVFMNDPWSIDNMVLLIESNPKVKIDPTWFNHYKQWYLRHVSTNLGYINDRGLTQDLIDVMHGYDKEFAIQLESSLLKYQENFEQS